MMSKRIQLLTILLCVISLGVISLFLGQDINWDLQNYHYYNGYAFFHLSLTQDFLAANIQSYFNPYVDAINYILITHLPPKLTGFLLGAIQGVNFYLLALMVTMLAPAVHLDRLRLWIIFLIVLLAILSANVLGEIGTTFNDLTVANGVMLALVLMIRAIDTELAGHKKWLLVLSSGIALGVATALKLTMGIYAIAAVLAVIAIRISWLNKIKLMMLLSMSTMLGFLLLNGHWMYLLERQFGNPVFPFYNAIFKSPNYYLVNPVDLRFFPRNLMQTLFYPFYFSWQKLTAEVAFRDFRLPVVYLLLIIYAGKIIFTQRCAMTDSKKYLLTFFMSSYVLWQLVFSAQRYAIILDMLAPLLIYILLESIFENTTLINKLGLLLFIFLVVSIKPMHWGRLSWKDRESYFDVQIPKEINLQQPGIVFTDYPTGFIRAFFPVDWHFLSLDHNGNDPDRFFLKKFLQDNVNADQYRWYLLFPGKSDIDIIQKYGFKLTQPCLEIKAISRIYSFCEIQRQLL